MADVLIVYATRHGSTEQVARRIGEVLRASGVTTQVEDAEAVTSLEGFRGVVLGGSIYMGRWHKDATGFLHRYRETLAELPFAAFALGPGRTPSTTSPSRASSSTTRSRRSTASSRARWRFSAA